MIKCKIQNAEVMDITWYDTFPALIPEELMQQDTDDHLESPVRQLSHTYAHVRSGDETLNVLNFLAGKTSVCWTTQYKMWHFVFLSHIYLLNTFVNVLNPQPTEQY